MMPEDWTFVFSVFAIPNLILDMLIATQLGKLVGLLAILGMTIGFILLIVSFDIICNSFERSMKQ